MYDVLNFPLINTANDTLGSYRTPYVVFNSIEAAVWVLIAAWILVRWARRGKSKLELLYALSFVLFGLSDVIETFGLTLLLLLMKAACLLAIIGFRAAVLPTYPGSKL